MSNPSEIIAKELLSIEAIKLNVASPFTWASGWKSPIYCDNRLSLSYPDTRSYIKEKIADSIKQNFSEAEAIAGVATAGIPQGALVADLLNIPFIYVRSKPKGHGMENMIEGEITPGQKVVVIEDLVSTGGSSLKAIEALKKSEFEVLGMVAIFTYDFDIARENFEKAGVRLVTLSDYNVMIQEAQRLNYVTAEQADSLRKWRTDPANWKP